MLFNVTPGDPLTFVLVLTRISLVTVLAAAVPARFVGRSSFDATPGIDLKGLHQM
jgi:hypothetical protein